MAVFQSFSPGVEVSGRTIVPVAEGMPLFGDSIKEILATKGNLSNVVVENWYSQQDFLNALGAILEKFGPSTLFNLGKTVTDSYPLQFTDLKVALLAVNDFYQANHRNGDAGACILKEYNLETKTAVMECNVAYPSEFQRGVLISVIRKYKTSFGLVSVDRIQPETISGNDNLQQFKICWP